MKQKITLLVLLTLLFNTTNAQIVITEVFYDTPYNERTFRLNVSTNELESARRHHWGEFIEIYNYSDKDLILSDWYIQDKLATVQLPGNKTIKSGELMVIAYSQLPYNTTPFTELFSRTQGKEAQVILQDRILLRNKRETIKLVYKAIDGRVPLERSSINWDNQTTSFNQRSSAWTFPDLCYEYNSLNLNSSNTFSSAPSNPLEAAYKPPIQSYESIMMDTYQQYYSYLDWSEAVYELINKVCGINIPIEQQTPNGTYLNTGKCFQYDSAGNNDQANDCNSPDPGNPPATNAYTYDQLEEIKNNIKVYPNPATANNQYIVNISWDGPALNNIYELKAFTSGGGLLYSINPTAGVNSASFSLANQLPGVFVINFKLNTGQIISKNILKW